MEYGGDHSTQIVRFDNVYQQIRYIAIIHFSLYKFKCYPFFRHNTIPTERKEETFVRKKLMLLLLLLLLVVVLMLRIVFIFTGKEGWELVATDSQRPDMSSKNVIYMKRRRMTYTHPLQSKTNDDDEDLYISRPYSPKPFTSSENGHKHQ
jgi:hypothetical protein